MDNSNVFVRGNHQVNEEKPPPRVCPRCNSDNTKFCYYNNYSVSQPRYNCKNCRRFWTHGGALRNIPIGGSGRKIHRTTRHQPSVSQVVSVEIQRVDHHQHFLHVQETNEFVGSFVGSSSSSIVAVGNHFGSFPELHGDMLVLTRSFGPMDRSDFNDRSIQRDHYDVGFNNLIGNPLINQSIGGSVVVSSDHNGYGDQEDQNKWNHRASTTL